MFAKTKQCLIVLPGFLFFLCCVSLSADALSDYEMLFGEEESKARGARRAGAARSGP